MARSLAKRRIVALIAIVVVVVLVLGYGSLRDALNPILASAQGCPGLLTGDTFAFNDGCPLDVHPWLIP